MPASAKGTARTGQRQQSCCRNPGWVSLWVPDSERGEREAESVIPSVKKRSELAWSKKGVRRGAGGWKLAGGLCSGCYLHGESNKTMFTHKWAPPGPISCSNKIKGDGWSREQQAELVVT